MGRKQRQLTRKGNPTGETSTPGKVTNTTNLPASRKWAYRVLGAVLIPLLLFGSLELVLRAGGYGYSTCFFIRGPSGSQAKLFPNPKFGRRFFPAALARAPLPSGMDRMKAPDTFRVFIFGESAALGDPRPQFGAGRYLEALLRQRFPHQRFEIINTSMTAINSHVILPIARDCAGHQADAWIIYMGNNEMVGPFGAATVFGRKAAPAGLVRLNLALQNLRTGQLLLGVAEKLRKQPSSLAQWGGMQMFTENQVGPEDPSRKQVHENFRRNLEDILRAGAGSGTRIILNTVAVNLKDCPPFGSLPPSSPEFENALAKASAAAWERDYPSSVQQLKEAIRLMPLSAQAHYGLAEGLLALTNKAGAKEQYELARDCDTLPFRSDSTMNELVRKAAEAYAAKGVLLCDAAGAFATNSPAGVPGQDFFFEHVHFTSDGNYRLGLLWAEQLAQLLPASGRQQAAPDWASQEECEKLLGLTEWNRVSIVEEVVERMGQPPLSTQPNNSNRVHALTLQIGALREKMAKLSTGAVNAVYQAAIRQAPEDYMLREAYAEFLLGNGDQAGEVAQREKIAELTPTHYFSFLNLGIALRQQRQFAKAEAALNKAVSLNPLQPEVRLELGAVYGLEARHEAAIAEFQKAGGLARHDPRPLQLEAESLWKMNRRQESVERLRKAVRLQPQYLDARYKLGEELAQLGDIESAASEFREVLRLKPGHEKARFNLAIALARQGRLDEALQHCDELLRVRPQNKLAAQLREQILTDRSRR